MRTFAFFVFLTLTLDGCSPFTPKAYLQSSPALPPQFSMYSQTTNRPNDWWHDFKRQDLNVLMEEAITENFSIRETWGRLQQALAATGKTGADRYPAFSYTTGRSWAKRQGGGQSQSASDGWSLVFSASYELDLWGRVAAANEGAALTALASSEDLRTAIMTVSGQVAETWINLLANEQQQQLLHRQLALQYELRDLVQARFPLAKSTALDIYQQQQSIENLAAGLIPLKNRQEISRRQLALLLGKTALEADIIDDKPFPELPPIPPLGLPADLLSARPDIRAAGLRLQAAEWEITAAEADRLPALRLTANQTYSAAEISSLFDNWLRNLAANLSGPIFDGQRRRAEIERTRGVAEERLATYGKTVFRAINEVEDALTEEKQQEQTLATLHRMLALSQNTMREATRRYLNGNSDFLNVLKEEFNLLQVQQDIINAEKEQRLARIKLYRALGGSWTDRYTNQ